MAKVLVALRSLLSFLAWIPLDLQFLARVRIREDVAKLNPILPGLPWSELEKEPELSIRIRDLNLSRCEFEGWLLDEVANTWTCNSSSDGFPKDEGLNETLELLLFLSAWHGDNIASTW